MTDDGRVAPVLPQIDDLPRLPDGPLIDSLMQICKQVCDDCGADSVAMLLSRPRRSGITATECAWAERLADAAAAAGVALWQDQP